MGIHSVSNLGPGAYNPKSEFGKSSNPTYGFSKGKKGITSRDISPGPGAYTPDNK